VIRGRRFDRHIHHLPGVKPYARTGNLVPNCPLSDVHSKRLSLLIKIAKKIAIR
jgi:hypothetical protein